MRAASPTLHATTTRLGRPVCGRCRSVHPLKVNPWGICPEPLDAAAVTLDVWATASGRFDGAVEISPGSSISPDRARDLVVTAMRAILDTDGELLSGHPRWAGGARHRGMPEDGLSTPTCTLTMAWDERQRLVQGPGFGPLDNARRAPASVVPIRDLVEWTLTALGPGSNPAR